jgi:prepilin signal peptidase PulO-like enzyme (type II secretory pathway)
VDDLECPKCHQKTIPLWRKMCLGPATGTTCAKCGSKVSVPYSSMIALVPFLIAIVAAQMIGSLAVAAFLVIGGVLAMCWFHYKFVPLIVK